MATTPGWNGSGTGANAIWKYYDTDGTTLLFTLKGLKDPEANGVIVDTENKSIKITEDSIYRANTTTNYTITYTKGVGGYKLNFANDVNFSKTTFTYNNTTYPSLEGAIFYPDTKTYDISTAAQLAALATFSKTNNCAGMTFNLKQDIDLSELKDENNNTINWTAIGTSGNAFMGTFNGNNHVIRNLSISSSTSGYQGLFGATGASAIIQDVTLSGVSVAGTSSTGYVGGLIGYATGGTIKNCNLTGNVTVTGTKYVGGLIGSASDSAVITNCDIDNYDEDTQELLGVVTVTSTAASATGIGGLIGYVQSSNTIVKGCDIIANLSVIADDSGTDVGGLIGSNLGAVGGESAIDGCTVSGKVTVSGNSDVGGIVGDNKGIITSCTFNGTVEGSSNVGGIIGNDSNTTTRTISGNRFSGSVGSDGATNVGGIIGNVTTSGVLTVKDNVVNGTLVGSENLGAIVGSGTLENGSNSFVITNAPGTYDDSYGAVTYIITLPDGVTATSTSSYFKGQFGNLCYYIKNTDETTTITLSAGNDTAIKFINNFTEDILFTPSAGKTSSGTTVSISLTKGIEQDFAITAEQLDIFYKVILPVDMTITNATEANSYTIDGTTYYKGDITIAPKTGFVVNSDLTGATYNQDNGTYTVNVMGATTITGTVEFDTAHHYVFQDNGTYTLATAENASGHDLTQVYQITLPEGVTTDDTDVLVTDGNKIYAPANAEITLTVTDNKITGIIGATKGDNDTYTYSVTDDATLEVNMDMTIAGLNYNEEDSYYEISSIDNLNTLVAYVNGTGNNDAHDCAGLKFKLTASIDASGVEAMNDFKGRFVGGGNLLNNVSVDIFGTGGTVQNLYYRGTGTITGGTKVYTVNLPESESSKVNGTPVIIDGKTYYKDDATYNGTPINSDITYYIDSDGKIKLTSDYTTLTGNETTLTEGWYVVDSDITISNTLNISGEVHLILADGAKLTLNSSSGHGINGNSYSYKLNIYGQANQSGELEVTSNSTDAISVLGEITINGGKITANSPSYGIRAYNYLTINGGKITNNSGWGISALNTTLNLKNDDDFIQTSRLYVGGTLTVVDGKRFYDQNGDVYSGSMQIGGRIYCGELKLLNGYVIKVPSGVEITGATQIGSSNAYIFAENANLTLTGFDSGEITFDSAITALTNGENSITATTSDGKTFNISVNTSAGSKGWTIDGTNATYSSNFTAAGADIDGLTIVYQPVEDKTFTISGLKSNLTADELKAGITIDGNNVTVAESLLDTSTDGISISDGYTLDLDAPKSKDFSGYGLQTLDNGNVAYITEAGNTAGWKIIDGVWKYVAASGVKGFELSGVGSIDGISVNDGVVTIENEFIDEIDLVSNDGGYIFDFTNSYDNYFCEKQIISDGNNRLKFGGTSSSDIFYAITSLEDLQTLHNVTSSEPGTPPEVFTDGLTFKLTADIDLDGENYCISENQGFSGTFDGNGHSISNVSDYLIYNSPSGTIKNLLLINVSTDEPFTNIGNYENVYFYNENDSSVHGATRIYKLTLQGVTATGYNVKIFGNDTYAAGEVNFSAKTGYNYAENTAEITSDTTITATLDENNHYVIDNGDGTYQLADESNTTDYPDLIQVYELTLNGVEVSGGNPITIEGKNYYFGGSTVTFTKKNGYNYNVDSESITIDSDKTITATLDDTKHYVFDNGNGYTLATAENTTDYPDLTQVYELTLQGVTATGDILVTDGGKTYATGEITLAAKTGYNYTGENSATIDDYATFTANFDADPNNHYVLASDTSKIATAADVSDYPDLIKVWKVSGLPVSDNIYTIDGEIYIADGAEVTIGSQTFKISADSQFVSANYVDNSGETQEGYAIPITDATTTINGGWYVVNGDVNLAMLTISGNVHLILADNANLTVQNTDASTIIETSDYGKCGFGIYGELGANLNIYCQNGGTGTLTANYIRGYDYEGYDIVSRSFGIYADNINIYGGNVNATSNEGIRAENGDIKVYGGTLTVNGTNDVAIRANNVEISGGTVNSTGQDGIYAVDEVKISGGSVNLTGTGCGINANNVNINGGNVIATGNGDSGIWAHGMYDEDDNLIGGDVNISGGTVEATGIYSGIDSDGNVNISGGTVEATGIYSGIDSDGNVNITGGKIKAISTGEDDYPWYQPGIKGICANWDNGTINLSWTNPDDYVYTNSYNRNVTFSKDFWNADGNINQTNGKLYAKSGSIVTLPTGVSIDGVPKIDNENKYIAPANTYTLTLADGVAINGSTTLTVENNNMTPALDVYYAVTPPAGYKIASGDDYKYNTYEVDGTTYYKGDVTFKPSTGYSGDDVTKPIDAPNQKIDGGTLNLDTENHYVFANGDGYTLADAESVKNANYPALIQAYTIEGIELTAGGDIYCVKDGVAYVKTGGTVTIGVEDYTVNGDSAYVSYNDGSEQQTLAKILTDADISLGSGWYVVNSDLTIDNTLEISGEVNLILSDGATLTINNENGEDYAINANGTLNIYGQSAGTGKLTATSSNGVGGIYAGTVNIYGGTITASGHNNGIWASGEVNINGGQVTATSGTNGITANNINLGWTKDNDYIDASSYEGTVTFASGKRFYDANGNVATTSSTGKLSALDGYIVTVPEGVTVTGATKIDGTTDKYIVKANGTITVNNFKSGDITFDEAITGLAKDNSNIIAKDKDGNILFTVSGLTFASDTTTWTLSDTTATYNRKIVAGAKVDNATITWDSTANEISFSLTGLKSGLSGDITVDGNDIYVGKTATEAGTKIGTLTITGDNYAVTLDRDAALAETPTTVALTNGTGATFALTITKNGTAVAGTAIEDTYTWSDIANGELTYTLDKKNESWTKTGNSYEYQAGRADNVQQFKLTGLNSTLSGVVSVVDDKLYVGKTEAETGTLIGTFDKTTRKIALNANALPTGFNGVKIITFEGTHTGYTLGLDSTDTTIQTQAFQFTDGNKATFTAASNVFTFKSPTYSEYFTVANDDTITAHPKIDSQTFTLTIDNDKFTAYSEGNFNVTAGDTAGNFTLGNFGSVTATTSTNGNGSISGFVFSMNDNFLGQIAQGGKVELSGGTFADITATATVATNATTKATAAATFDTTSKTYTAQITEGDYFSKNDTATKIEHVAQVGGQKFTLSGDGLSSTISINSFTVDNGNVYLKAEAFSGDDGKSITLMDDANDIGDALVYKLAYDSDGTKGLKDFSTTDYAASKTEVTTDTAGLQTLTYKAAGKNEGITLDNNTATYNAATGGEPFTLSGLYVPTGYTLDVNGDKIIATKADGDPATITLATVGTGGVVTLNKAAFNENATAAQTVTLTDNTDDDVTYTLQFNDTTTKETKNAEFTYDANKGVVYTAAMETAYYAATDGASNSYTFTPQANGQQFIIRGLNGIDTNTVKTNGNKLQAKLTDTEDLVDIGTLDNNKFTLTNVAALGTVSDSGATISLQNVAPVGSATAIDYTLGFNNDFNSVNSVPAKAGDNYNKGDAATDGTYTYTYTAAYTPAYTLDNGNNSYTYHKEETHDTVAISGLKDVDNFSNLIIKSDDGKFMLSEGILPTVADGTINLTVNGTGSYTLGLGTDVATKSYQVDDTAGGSIANGAYTPPTFRAYYEVASGAQSITTHASIAAPTSAPFTISGLGNYTATYTNNENGGGTATIDGLGTIAIDASGNYTVKLKASALQNLLTPTETSKDFTLSKTTNKTVEFTVTGDNDSAITTAENPTVTTGKAEGWYDYAADANGYKAVYKSDAYDDYWKTATNGYTYTKAVEQTNLVTINGLKEGLTSEQLKTITATAIEGGTGYSVTITQDLLNTVEGATISVDTGNTLTIEKGTGEYLHVGSDAAATDASKSAALAGTGNTYTYTTVYNEAYFAGTNGGNSYTYHIAQTPDTFDVSGLNSDYSNETNYTLVVEGNNLIARPKETGGTDVTLGTLNGKELSLTAAALPTLDKDTTIKLTSSSDYTIEAIGNYSLTEITPADVLSYEDSTYTFKQNYHDDYFKPNTDATAKSSYTFVPTANDGTFTLSGTALASVTAGDITNVADYVTVDADKKVTLKPAILKSSPTEGDTISISGGDYTLNNPQEIKTTQAEGFYAGATDDTLTLDYKLASTEAGYEEEGTVFTYKAAVTGNTPFSITGLPTDLKDYTFSVNASNEIIASKDGAASVTLGTFDKDNNAVTLKQELWTDLDATPDAVALTGTGTLTITKGTSTVADSNSADAVPAHTYGWTATTPADGVATYEQHKRDELWTKTAVNSYKFNAEVAAATLFTLSGLADTATLDDSMVSGKNVNVTNILPKATNTTLTLSNSEYALTVDDTVKRVFTKADDTGIVTAAAFDTATGKFTSSHTDQYYLKSDTSITYKGGTKATSFKLSGVTIPETATVTDEAIGNYVTIDGDTVTVKAAAVNLNNYSDTAIALTEGDSYTLALDDSLLLTDNKKHTAAFTSGTETGNLAQFNYKGAFNDAYFDAVSNNTATFVGSTESDAATFTVSNLSATTDVATLLDALNGTTLTLTTELLPSATDLGTNKITISDDYTLELTTGIQPAAFNDQFTGDSGTYSFTAGGKLQGFYNEDGEIVYHAADNETYFTTDTKKKFTISGLATNLGTLSLVGQNIYSAALDKNIGTLIDGTIKLNSDALTTGNVELQTTSGYALELDDSLLLTDNKKHSAAFTKGTETDNLAEFNYKGAFNDAHFNEVSGNVATFVGSTESQAATFTVINLSATTDVATLLAALEGTTLTLTSELLPSATDLGTNKITISDGYTLQLAPGIEPEEFSDQFTGGNGEYEFTAGGKLQGFYNDDGKIVYHAADSTNYFTEETKKTFTLTGLATNLGELSLVNGEIISSTTGKAIGTFDGTTVKLNSDALTTGNVELQTTSGYALELDDSLLLTDNKKHSAAFTKGTESGTLASFDYKGAFTDAHFDAVDNNVANFVPSTETQAATFTVSNLSATTDVATLLDALNGTTLTLTTELLPSATDLGTNKITISDGYTLELTTGIQPATFSDQFTGDSGTYTFTAGGKLQGFYNENGEIVYHAADDTTYFTEDTKKKFTLTGLAKNLGTLSLVNGEIISSTTGKAIGTFDGTTVKLNSDALTTGNVELQTTYGYTLAVDSTVVAPKVYGTDGWSAVVNGKASYSTATTTEGWTLEGNKIKYTAAKDGDGELFTISGLRKGITTLTQYGNNIMSDGTVIGTLNKDTKVITLNTYALPTAADDTYVEIIGDDYKLELGELPVASTRVDEKLTLSGTTATYTSPSMEAGYVLSDDKQLLTYAATNSTTFTITGLKSGLGTLTLNGDDIKAGDTVIGTFNKSTGVITLNKNALSTGTTKLTGDGYSLELAEGLTKATTINGAFTEVDAANGTATYTTTAISDYYTSTAANTFTYVAAVDSANLVINGLKGDALEINSVANHITVTNEDKVISVTINDRTLLGKDTVTFTKPAGYTLDLNVNHSITTGAVDGKGRWYYSGGNICAYTVGDIQEYYNVVGETLEYVPATHKDSNQRIVLSGVNSTSLTSEDIEFSEAAGTVTFKKKLGNIVQVLKNSAGYKYIFANGVEPFRFIGAGTDDTINVTSDGMTIHGGDGNDVISFAEGTTDGVVELSGGNDTIAYDTNYKIKFHGTRSQKVIGNDVVFSYGSTSLTVTDALGKIVNIIDSNGTESTVKIFENYDSMLTYSDYRKYGVTLNGSAEVNADSSKSLFTEDSLKSTGYSANVISIKASDSMTKSVFIEGNAKSNFVIGNNRSGNTLNGGKGNDSIIGGTGADVFYYKSGDGNDTISNYESKDTIMLVDLTDEDITSDKVSVSGNDLVYTLGKNKLRVQNVFSSSDKATVKLITDDGNTLYTYDKSKGSMTSGKTIGILASATTYAVTAGETITGYRPDVVLTGIAVEDLAKTNVRVATNTITLGLNSSDSVVISGIDTSDQLNLNGTLYTVGKNYLSTGDTKYILTSGNVDGLDLTNATEDSTIDATLTSSGVEIVGGAGNDQLIGGTGNDQFTGNGGSDVFIYSGGNDTITDYNSTQGDVISLNAVLNFADITFAGNDLTINGATGNSLAIKNGTGKTLTINDGTGAKNYTFQDDGAMNADGTVITLKADHGNYTAIDNVSSIDASAASLGAVITARNANSFITAGDKGLTLVGGTGKDTLLEGTGNSKLTGNTGDDLFIIGGGDDTITDYGTGSDSVTLTDYTMNDLTGVTKNGKNVALTFGSDKLKIDNPAVEVITIDGKGYKFDNGKATTDDNKGVILVTESTVDLSTAYTDEQTILANGGGKITAGAIGKTIGGKNVTLVGGTGKDTFIYNGDDMNIQNYDANNDVISLSAGYSINDSQVSGSTVTLTITDGTNNGSMTINVGKSNSFVVKTDKGDEPLYLKKVDFAFDDDDPEIATAVTVVADKGDFGVQGDSLDSGTTKDEFYQELESITATKENSTLTGNANCNNFYVKGGGANVLTGGIGKDYFVFNSGGGVITDYGSGSTKLGDRSVLAGTTTQTTSSGYIGYDRKDPGTYKEGLDVLQVNGTVKEIAYTGRGDSNTKYNSVFTAYVTYEDNSGDDYVIKLDNIYKTPTKYGSSPNYRTDDYVAARFQIWDTSSDGSTMARLTLTDNLFTSDVTAAENLLTDLMSAKPLTTTGNMFGSSNPLTSNSSNSNSAPVVVSTNGDKNNG